MSDIIYRPIVWENEYTPLNESNLNHMEEGIVNVSTALASFSDSSKSYIDGQVQLLNKDLTEFYSTVEDKFRVLDALVTVDKNKGRLRITTPKLVVE